MLVDWPLRHKDKNSLPWEFHLRPYIYEVFKWIEEKVYIAHMVGEGLWYWTLHSAVTLPCESVV